MSKRDEILRRLKAWKPAAAGLAAHVSHARHYPDLAARFKQALDSHNGEVWLVGDAGQAWEKAVEILREAGVKMIVSHRTELPPCEPAPEERFAEFEWHFAGEQDFRAICAQAGAGLTGADVALAETGTLVLTSGADRARMTSLLPPLHVVLLPKTRLVSDIFVWKQQRQAPLPANLMFISGPSKTGDIEQALVVGVHGPKRLVVIVY